MPDTKPTPFNCFKSGCVALVRTEVFARVYHSCEECGLVINSMVSCPKADPYPDPPKKNKTKSQTKEAQVRQIRMAEIKRDARKFQTYESKINTLLKDYK